MTDTTNATGVLGAPVDRRDGAVKTSGRATYSTDVDVEGIVHAALAHATVARGRITVLDVEAAARVPGVLAVLTYRDRPAMRRPGRLNPLNLASLAPGVSSGYLLDDEVHYDGEPIAVVVAESLEAAHEAAALVRAEYEAAPDPVVDFPAVAAGGAPQRPMPIGPPLGGSKGDAEAALAQAAHRVDATFVTPPQNHNALEPHGCTVVWTGSGRDAQVTVWDGSQNVDWVKRHLARTFGLAPGQVRVISEHVGGAFGGRTMVWAHTVLAALAARETGRPVRLQLTREGVYRTVGGRSPSIQRVALSAGDDGRLTALIHTAQLRKGAVGGAAEQVVSCSHDLYDASAMRLGTQLVSMDLLPNQVMRAPGEANGTFALESALDMLAASTGLDPIELRRRNLAPSRGPIDGKEFSQRRILEAFDVATSAFGWADRPVAPRSMRDGRWLVGWGAATAFHPAWQFPAHLRLSVAATGTVTLECAFHELGMGAPTAVAQLVADRLDVPLPAVEVRYGDTSLPTGPGAGGSGQSASIAASVDVASRRLVATLDRLGRRTDGGAFGDGRSAHERYTEIVRRSGRDEVTVELGPRSGLAATWSGLRDTVKLMRDQRRWLKAAAGAQLCEVRVDADTGEVRVTRWVGAYDIGRVINAKTAASQIRGGVVMGIGLALTEATLVDPRRGRIMNPSLTEYHVPVHADVPPIEVHLLDHPDPQTPLGILGAGEVGITGAGAAVANAIWHATGSRVTELPITLDAVLPRPAGS